MRRWESRKLQKNTQSRVCGAAPGVNNSMPGPDGIPAAAYKALGNFAIDILHQAVGSLCSPDFDSEVKHAYVDRAPTDEHGFNHSLLCCLPKKAAGTDPELGQFFRGEDTRPLALVNVDNCILASAARMAWEPLLNFYISKHQQGFLKGRSMLANIIDIDYHAMTVSLKLPKGAVFYFRF